MYSLRTVPAVNSSVNCRAQSAERGMIINPEVSRSSLLAAASQLMHVEGGCKLSSLTITFGVSKIVNEDLNE